ncbi:hypothetical protein I350_07927 [Cryptococcus amylolentus CBS 6273]|uniref:Transcription initiation factor TFIID subunit 10 n=1 Tax=Cryptococcus amylolentus CBS 6273 TaxID=1296118 RepID=A0A1E3J7Y8_9TREE|nr:hypothetical protein I350_07927 [Cryptococcus amylolentus CBS 6273]
MSAPPPSLPQSTQNSAAPSPVPSHTPTPPTALNGLPRPVPPAAAGPAGPAGAVGAGAGVNASIPGAAQGMQAVRPLSAGTVSGGGAGVGAGAGAGVGSVRAPLPAGQFQRTFPPSTPSTQGVPSASASASATGARPPAPSSAPSLPHSQGQGQAQAGGGSGNANPGPSTPSAEDNFWAARREEEVRRRDRSLGELLVMLDGYTPLVPEEVTEYFLQKSGFDCSDPRLKRLLSLVSQKFISDLSKDAFYYSKLRVNGAPGARGRPTTGTDKNRVVLTMDDLSLALGEHGVNVKAPDYYI